MKKPLSIILNILSIISAVITVILAAFCAFDWIKLASTSYAYTIEFWMVIDYYALGMLIFSGVGFTLSIVNLFITDDGNLKNTPKIMAFLFAAVVIISLVLYLLPINI